MSFPWTDEIDAQITAMRADGVPFPAIGKAVGASRGAVQGRYYRQTDQPSVRKPRKRSDRPRKVTDPRHYYRSLKPSKTPFAADISCPDFAWDDDHCAAVLAIGTFPVLPRRADRRSAT